MPIYYNIKSIQEPNGIKEISSSTKTIKAIAFPRRMLKEFNQMPEAERAGVYLLYNTADKNEQPHIYIGQTSYDISARLKQHDKKKDFWNYALIFVEKGDAGNMNGIHTKIIESMLLYRAKECGVVVVDNATGSNPPYTHHEDHFNAQTWAEEIIDITLLLGLAFFDNATPIVIVDPPKPQIDKVFICEACDDDVTRCCSARGIYLGDGHILVLKGSIIAEDSAEHFHEIDPKIESLRRNGIIVGCKFVKDYEFGSPSAASNVIMRRSSNGWVEWKDENGICLKTWQGR